MIDKNKNLEFWNKAALKSNPDNRSLAGMLVGGNEFEAIYRRLEEQKHFQKICSIDKQTRILEVGCGGGRWGFWLEDKVLEYIGIDISPQMIQIAELERSQHDLKNIKFKCTNFNDFESNNKFDIVYFSSVLQYMDEEDVVKSIKKAKFLLKKNGIIISRDTIQSKKRNCKTGDYPVIYRTISEYVKLFENEDYELDYTAESYKQKRFKGLAYSIYKLSCSNYTIACFIREILCNINALIELLLINKYRYKNKYNIIENKQEHRFFKYIYKKLMINE